jgi:hypothetical protein
MRNYLAWRRLVVTAVAAALTAMAAPTGAAAEPAQPPRAGFAHSARGPAPASARQVKLTLLPNATPAELAARPRVRIGTLSGASPSVYAARKAIAAHRGATAAPSPPPPPASGAPSPQTSAPEVSFTGNVESDCGNAAPSDQALAIGDGSSPVLQVNQDCLSVWSAAGARLLGPKTLQSLAGLPASNYVFDPRALYDFYNHRFILAFGDSDLTNNSYYDIAVSQSDDPTGGWNVYRFPTASQNQVYNDFLRIGQDREGVYIASNLFQMQGSCCGPFIWEEWVLLPKSLLYSGSPLSYWYLSGFWVDSSEQTSDSSQPANVWSPYDNPPAEFFVLSYNINFGGGNCVSGCGGLLVWAVSNPFGFLNGSPEPPVLSYAFTGSFNYYLPPQASQPGAPNSIETLDTRITGEVTYSGGYLYAALTSGDNSWSDIQSYKIAPFLGAEDASCIGAIAGDCPELNGATTEDYKYIIGNGNFYYYPTPEPDLEGNVALVFNFSGPNCANCYPSVGFVTERVTQPYNTFFDSGLLLQTGANQYLEPLWGRYTAVAPASVGYGAGGVVDTPGVGFAGAYARSDGSWATQIGYTAYTAPNQP